MNMLLRVLAKEQHKLNAKDEKEESQEEYNLFTDMVAILNSIVSNSYYGMFRPGPNAAPLM